MPATGYALGVDFGTSNTVAVLRRPDGHTQPLLFDGSPILPSAVYADADGALVVGKDAVQSSRLHPARYEPNPKRRVDDGSVRLGEREIAVVDLMAAVLGRVVEEVRRAAGDIPETVVLTCPAGWGATRRLTLRDAATRAGLPDPVQVEEPVAAAAYFARVLGRDVPIGSVVVVHDLGAGTFDASVVARTSSGFEVLAVDGRTDLGGLDLDRAIVEHLGSRHAERNRQAWERLASPSTVEDKRSRRLLWDDVRAAKERLSRLTTADLVIPLLEVETHLTRTEFEELAQPLLEQTVRVTQGVMRWAKIAEGRSAGVFLVGGSSRIPLMVTLLHKALGEPPVVIEQPELVVAEGSLVIGTASPIAAAAWVSGSKVAPTSPAAPTVPIGPTAGRAERLVEVEAQAHPEPAASVPVPATEPKKAAVPATAAGPAEEPTVPSEAPTVPVDEPTLPVDPPASQAAPQPPAPKWSGRVIVPGARGPGQAKKPAGPTTPTQRIARYSETRPTVPPGRSAGPARPGPAGPPRRKRGRRVLTALLAILLLLAVPVVSAYVAYKLTAGESPFEWPPSVDYDTIFGK